MTAMIRALSRAEVETAEFWSLLWDAAGVDSDALGWIRDVELPKLTVIGAIDPHAHAVVGFAAYAVRTDPADHLELEYLAVVAEERGSGLGSRLIEAVRRSAPELALRAQTDDDAVAFYRSLGFAIEGAPCDPRWPERERYDCRVGALGDPAEATLAAYRAHALRYAQRTPTAPSPLVGDLLALISPGARVLELGSGPGRDADALDAAGLTVERTDGAASFAALQHAAGHTVRVLDVRAPDFGGPFDAVYANAVLLHVPREDLGAVLDTARRATVPGGVIAASFKAGDGERWSERKLDAPRHFTYWRTPALAEAFADAGWTDVRTREQPARTDGAETWIFVTARAPGAN